MGKGGGGSSGPTQTTSTVQNTNIPEYARGYVENMLGATQQQLFQGTRTPTVFDPETGQVTGGDFQITGFKPYQAYGGTYDAQGNQLSYDPSKAVAGFSPMQLAAQQGVANMQLPGQFAQGSNYANMAGMGGMQSAQDASAYGGAGYRAGLQGQRAGFQGQQAGLMGQQSGLMGQQLGVQGGAQYGNMGANAGMQGGAEFGGIGAMYGTEGANLGTQGGARFGNMGAGYGQQAAGLAGTALGYGNLSSQIGQMGLEAQQTGRGITAQSQNLANQQAMAGQQYAQQATNPNAMQAYMSPYMQNVVDVQNREAKRNADIAGAAQQAQAAQAGAFGGGRDAIMRSERARNLATLQNQNQAQGLQNAYQQAQQAQQFGASLGLQGLGGAQSGLGTALQGGQLGLSGIGTALQGQQGALAGVGAANQAYQTGIQGAGMGLQGVNTQLAGTAQGMQGAQIGLQGVDRQLAGAGMGLQGVNTQLAGTAQGMQGAQSAMQGAGLGIQGAQSAMQGAGMGLQGVQGAQAGYGLANQAGANLANIGSQQQAAQLGIYNAQNQFGGQQQAYQQAIINQAMLDYANAQQYPLMQLGTMSNMLRGLPMQASTTNQYAASPNPLSQAIGTIGAGASIYNAYGRGASGGLPKEFKFAKGGIASIPEYDVGGEVASQLENMDDSELARQAKESASPAIRKMAERILREHQMSKQAQGPNAASMQYQAAQPQMPSYKPGGIVAFGGGGELGEETAGEAEAKATDTSGKTMEQRLAMEAPATRPAGGIMAAAPVTQVPASAAAPSPDIVQEAMRQRNIQATQAARPTADYLKDIQAEREAMGVGENKARDEFRAQQMAERANLKDEQERQRNMRLAEFFANWGSTPGPVLVAGMNALKQSIPNIISDEKEAKKARKEADKIIYDIDEATRLEKLGMIDKATALKEKAAQNAEDYNKLLLTYQSHKESNAAHIQASENAAAASIEHARIMAAAHKGTSAAADKRADEGIRFHMQQDALAKKKAVEGIDAAIAKEAEAAIDYKTAKRTVSTTKVDKKQRENAQAIVDKYESDWKARKAAAKDEYELSKDQLNEMNAKLGYGKKKESDSTTPSAPAAPAAAAPSVTIGGKTYTKPDNMSDAQWDAYKKSQGVK